MADFFFSPQTRATYAPSADNLNVSMDFNASPSGTARGTEVVIPNNASPAVRAAANQYNQLVASFAAKHGIGDYPVRGVRTRAENQRGVRNTVHTEPFFNTDLDMQRAIQQNPAEFASLYQSAFGQIPNARVIAPHGVGRDRGAASEIFGDETSFGEFIANTALGQDYTLPATQQQVSSRGAPQMATQPPQSRGAEVMQGLLGQMGMQRQDPSAQGDTAQPFYQRRKFADTMGNMAIAFNSLTQRPDKNLAASIMARREQRNELDKENRQRTEMQNTSNRTVAHLRSVGRDDLANMVEQGMISGKDAANVMFTKPDAGTAAMQNYAEYQRILTADGQEAADQFLEMGKGPSTNIQIGDGDAGELAKLDAQSLGEVSTVGMQARRNMLQLDQLSDLLANVETGAATSLKSLVGRFGIETKGLADVQAVEALINRMVPAMRREGSGPMSDRDLELFKASLPRLINTPEGNRTIIATMRVMAEYDAEGARIVQQVRDGELTNAQAFDALFAREHPAMWVREGDSEDASAATPAGTPAATPAGTPAVTPPADAPIEEVLEFYGGSGAGGGQ